MNYLAHVFLARHSSDAIVGALLGDFAKADVSGLYGEEIEREIRIHRRIDSYTDAHATTLAAKQLFRSETRRFAGIALDVFYDHVLAREWARYADMPLGQFTQDVYAALRSHREILPERLTFVADRMIEHDWLGSYADFESVRIAITRMSGRLSRNGEWLREGLVDLERHYDSLAEGFHAFFPELIDYARRERAALT